MTVYEGSSMSLRIKVHLKAFIEVIVKKRKKNKGIMVEVCYRQIDQEEEVDNYLLD